MHDLLLIIGLGMLYPVVHLANGWLFSFAEVNTNVGLIYLPAFLRLMHVLVLGKWRGTLATLLGGLVLMLSNTSDPLDLKLVNIACSAAGPLVALLLFDVWRQRPVQLVSLPDLATLTLFYCVANALLHHLAWVWMAPHLLGTPQQVLWMFLGDMIGTLMGAYLLKWAAERLGISGPR